MARMARLALHPGRDVNKPNPGTAEGVGLETGDDAYHKADRLFRTPVRTYYPVVELDLKPYMLRMNPC